MAQNHIKIAFFGTPDFAVPVLESLVNEGYEVVGVITQPDKEIGRTKTLASSPIKLAAQKYDIKVLQPISLKPDEFFEEFKNLKSDLCVVAAYGKIIPGRYLDIPKYKFICVHPSLLPCYRGPSPIQTAILNGEKTTGITIMVVDEKMDHGPLLTSTTYDIWPKTIFRGFEKEIWKVGAELLIKTIPNWITGKIIPQPQDESKATFSKMLNRDDGKIDWDRPADKIYNQIRALSEEPGTWTTWNGKVLNIKKAEFLKEVPEKKVSGTVFKVGGKITVAAQEGFIILIEIQPEGGKVMDCLSYANGHKDFVDSRLE